jgi:hypothetical protein
MVKCQLLSDEEWYFKVSGMQEYNAPRAFLVLLARQPHTPEFVDIAIRCVNDESISCV